jgi:hypothetical protein
VISTFIDQTSIEVDLESFISNDNAQWAKILFQRTDSEWLPIKACTAYLSVSTRDDSWRVSSDVRQDSRQDVTKFFNIVWLANNPAESALVFRHYGIVGYPLDTIAFVGPFQQKLDGSCPRPLVSEVHYKSKEFEELRWAQ